MRNPTGCLIFSDFKSESGASSVAHNAGHKVETSIKRRPTAYPETIFFHDRDCRQSLGTKSLNSLFCLTIRFSSKTPCEKLYSHKHHSSVTRTMLRYRGGQLTLSLFCQMKVLISRGSTLFELMVHIEVGGATMSTAPLP